MSALAASAEWTGGGTDLTIASAQRCTLQVVFTPEEAIKLREWRLHWVTHSESGGPLRVVESSGLGESGEVCDVRRDGNGTEGARVDTAFFCTSAGTAASSRAVRFVLDATSGAPARIAIIPILERSGALRADTSGIAEVTINGGCALSYPPAIVDVGYDNSADATTYRVAGAYLSDVLDARIWQPELGTTIPIQVLHRAADALELRGPLLERVRSGHLAVRNRGGQWASIPIDWSASGLKRTVAPRLVIRLERSSLSAPRIPAAGDTAEATIIPPAHAAALTQAGVASLRPLFSGEPNRSSSAKATNLIGEPIELAPLDDWFAAALDFDAEVADVLERVGAPPGFAGHPIGAS